MKKRGKGLATVIVADMLGSGGKTDSPDKVYRDDEYEPMPDGEEEMQMGLESAAEEIIHAMSKKDPAQLVEALKYFLEQV